MKRIPNESFRRRGWQRDDDSDSVSSDKPTESFIAHGNNYFQIGHRGIFPSPIVYATLVDGQHFGHFLFVRNSIINSSSINISPRWCPTFKKTFFFSRRGNLFLKKISRKMDHMHNPSSNFFSGVRHVMSTKTLLAFGPRVLVDKTCQTTRSYPTHGVNPLVMFSLSFTILDYGNNPWTCFLPFPNRADLHLHRPLPPLRNPS